MLHTFTNGAGVPMVARLLKPGEAYGLEFKLTAEREMVEFYDQRYRHTMLGQFVSRYDVETLLEHRGALCLDGGVPDWRITAANFASVMRALSLRPDADLLNDGMSHAELIDLELGSIEIGQLVVVRLKSGQNICGRVDDEGGESSVIRVKRLHDKAGARYSETQLHASEIACITTIRGYGSDEAHVFNFDV